MKAKSVSQFTLLDWFQSNDMLVTDVNVGGKHCMATAKVTVGSRRQENLYAWGCNEFHQLGQ